MIGNAVAINKKDANDEVSLTSSSEKFDCDVMKQKFISLSMKEDSM